MALDLYKSNTELLSAIKKKRFLPRLLTNDVIINAKSGSVYYDVFQKQFSPFSIMYAFDGEEYYEIDGVTLKATPSNFVVIPPGKSYSSFIDSDKEVHCLSIYFSEKLMNDLFTPSLFFGDDIHCDLIDFLNQRKIFQLDENSRKLLNSLHHTTQSDDNPDQLCLLMSDLVLQTFDAFKNAWQRTISYKASKISTKIELSRRLFLVKDYIFSNYQKEIDIKALAGISFMNHYYFIRKFKSLFGMTPYKMLIRRRLEVALYRIANSNDPISVIAKEVGYKNLPNFYTSFNKIYGYNPGEYRIS